MRKAHAMGYTYRREMGETVISLCALGCSLAALVVVWRSRHRGSRPEPGLFEDTSGAKKELEHLLADVREVTRERIDRLESLMERLGRLLEEGERKRRELEGTLERAAARAAEAGVPEQKRRAEADSRASEQKPVARPALPLHEKVYALKDEGRELSDICSATGLEKGEVELILGLRKVESAPGAIQPERGPQSRLDRKAGS